MSRLVDTTGMLQVVISFSDYSSTARLVLDDSDIEFLWDRLPYTSVVIYNPTSLRIEAKVIKTYTTIALRPLRDENRKMCATMLAHDRIVYKGNEIAYIIGEASGRLPPHCVRPSCLDVWRNWMMERYVDKWRRAVRLRKADRYKDIVNALWWTPDGRWSDFNKWAQLKVDHGETLKKAADAGWTV